MRYNNRNRGSQGYMYGRRGYNSDNYSRSGMHGDNGIRYDMNEGVYDGGFTEQSSGMARKEPRTKLVIDENTIYEIDLDCVECMEKNRLPDKS